METTWNISKHPHGISHPQYTNEAVLVAMQFLECICWICRFPVALYSSGLVDLVVCVVVAALYIQVQCLQKHIVKLEVCGR